MKHFSLGFAAGSASAIVLLAFTLTASAQTRSVGAGSLILDDGSGHLSTLQGSSTGGTYTLPAGGGALVTSTSPGSIPLGGIILWSGSIGSIPTGWALCDGGTYFGHTTPNLKDRFVVGAGNTYAVGATGGSNTPTYTSSGIVSTASATTGISVNSATTGISLGSSGPFGFINDGSFSLSGGLCSCGYSYTSTTNVYTNTYISSDPGHTHSITDPGHMHTIDASGITISTTDGRPLYYALAYIMRVQ